MLGGRGGLYRRSGVDVVTGLACGREKRSRGAWLAAGAGLVDGEVASGLLLQRARRERSSCGAQRRGRHLEVQARWKFGSTENGTWPRRLPIVWRFWASWRASSRAGAPVTCPSSP